MNGVVEAFGLKMPVIYGPSQNPEGAMPVDITAWVSYLMGISLSFLCHGQDMLVCIFTSSPTINLNSSNAWLNYLLIICGLFSYNVLSKD